MDTQLSLSNNSSLNEWSKWITGISLFSATGCVSVLITKGVGAKNITNIKLAIIFFLVNVIVAWLIQLVLALEKRKEIPVKNESISPESATPEVITDKVTSSNNSMILSGLIVLEIILVLLSFFYLARWIWNFPPAAMTKPIGGMGTALI